MSDSEQRIRAMVRTALEEDPRITNKVLLERAREIDADAVEGLSMRQFHGKFRLPVSRTLSDTATRARPKKRVPARSPRKKEDLSDETKRDAVRDIFRRFAVQLSRAEGRSDIVRAAARIDEFVEEVVRTFAGPGGTDTPPTRRKRRGTRSSSKGDVLAAAATEADGRSTAASDAPASATTLVGEPPARDMRRRRRPKASLKPPPASDSVMAAEDSTDAADAAPEDADQPAGERPGQPDRSAVFGLSHDLEEFRRRKVERERGGRKIP